MHINPGEIYGKQTASKYMMYCVLKVGKAGIVLQNIDHPLRLLEVTPQKLTSAYVCISQTPYVNTEIKTSKRRKSVHKVSRCPHTYDFLENRADSQRPTPIFA